MAEEEETLDEAGAVEALNQALSLQYRSALQFSLTSSSLTGIPAQAIGGLLIEMGDQELADARLLVEKIVSFEGTPTAPRSPRFGIRRTSTTASTRLIETEAEAIEALQQAIAPTGREGRSEALEHMLEHMIMRKQRQVDLLARARRDG